jgi:uronate dehydrogenase
MKRLLITGAAGGLGSVLREKLAGMADVLRLSDIVDPGPAGPNEETVTCDLGDYDAVMKLVEGCDGIVHLGGRSIEDTFEIILNANIRGTYHVYEAARKHGKPRIIFASSNHAIGFHSVQTKLDGKSEQRPDSIYGLSKCFGEDLATYYHDKFGVETVSIRIGSSFPEPRDRRMLTTWLSYDDLTDLIGKSFAASVVGHTVVYGASANSASWWDNSHAAFLGWTPKDSSEQFRAKVEAASPPQDPESPATRFQGGGFAAVGHYED